MPRYQKHPRIATSRVRLQSSNVTRVFLHIINLSAIVVLAWVVAWPGVAAATTTANRATRALVQPVQYVLVPILQTAIELRAHTLDYQLVNAADGVLELQVNAQYRLFNPTTEVVVQRMQLQEVATPGATGLEAGEQLAPELTLLQDEQPLLLESDASAANSTQIALAPDTRSTVRIQYTIRLENSALPSLHYSIAHLAQWPGSISLRVTFTLPETLSSDLWLRVGPDGWRYTPSDNAREPSVQWLFDANFPDQNFLLQFIHPSVGEELRAARQAANAAPAAAAFAELARLYQRLYDDPAISSATDDGEKNIRERFYAQALAVYLEGIEREEATGAASAELGRLHAGLATLYRSRVVGSAQDEQYVLLMNAQVERALALLPADAAQRTELTRWRIEGLYSLFQQARARQDWSQALALLEQLQSHLANGATGGSRLSAADLDDARRSILVQQALQVLAKGETEAAIALAGAEIQDAALAPASELQNLFAKWHVSSTVTVDGTTITALAYSAEGQTDVARNMLQNVVTRWQTNSTAHSVTLEFGEQDRDGDNPLRLEIEAPANTSHLVLAQALPDNANWALLRSLLTQLNPTVESAGLLVRRQTSMSQALDLRSVGDHWNAMAANLSQQAAAFAEEAARLAGDSASGEALKAQIQEVNFTNAAQSWRSLLQNSRVAITLTADEERAAATKS